MVTSLDKQKWLALNSQRTGIPAELLERAFRDELEGKRGLDDPLEIPDVMTVYYKYSYGQQSRFFREIRDNQRILGSKCTHCGRVYCPPRAACSLCYEPTEWVPLSGEGVIVTATVVHYATSLFRDKTPFVYAYIKLDGADTILPQNIILDDVTKAKPGLRVKAMFVEHRSGLLSDFYFVPIEGGCDLQQ